jgi:hypothetical protein
MHIAGIHFTGTEKGEANILIDVGMKHENGGV